MMLHQSLSTLAGYRKESVPCEAHLVWMPELIYSGPTDMRPGF
jgi:hypothetical protein